MKHEFFIEKVSKNLDNNLDIARVGHGKMVKNTTR